MKKCVVLLLLLLGTGFSNIYAPNKIEQETPQALYEKHEKQRKEDIKQQQINLFLLKLGKLESNNNWQIYNKYGYMGEWQLGALRTLGYHDITFKEFKKNPNIFPPDLQKEAVIKLMDFNEKRIDKYFSDYIGKSINGVEITKEGLLAAAHLGGLGSVRKYLYSNGKVNKRDAYKTSIEDYIKHFEE